MATYWKIRQYVPDSDDDSEEEALDFSELGSSEEEHNAAADGTQDQVGLISDVAPAGLQVSEDKSGNDCDKIPAPSLNTKSTQRADSSAINGLEPIQEEAPLSVASSSSALSSITSTPQLFSPNSQEAVLRTDTLAPPELSLDDTVLEDLVSIQRSQPARQLRERKAIQLNPYAIEGQLFKQVWKSRGLVPLQVKNHSQQVEEDTVSLASDLQDDSQSSNDQSNEVANVLQDDGLEFDMDARFRLEDDDDDGTEFPDLQSTSRPPNETAEIQGPKRRKLIHGYGKKDRNSARRSSFEVQPDGWFDVPLRPEADPIRPHNPSGARQKEKSHLHQKEMTVRRSVKPLSPMRTSSASAPESPALRSPLKFSNHANQTPPQLQTPLRSSEARPIAQRDYSPDLSTSGLPSARENVVISSDSEVVSESEEEYNEEDAIRQIIKAQRQTRGVLPASWHKLQYQKSRQNEPKPAQLALATTQRRPLSSTSPSRETRKGVAKRISKARPTTASIGDSPVGPIHLDDDSGLEGDNRAIRSPIKHQQQIDDFITTHDHFSYFDDDDNDDDDDDDDNSSMEDNRIDLMNRRNRIGRSRKSSKIRQAKRTRQAKISDVLHSEHQKGSTLLANTQKPAKTKSQTKQHGRPARITSRKKSKPFHFGIIDATNGLSRAETPSFLSIATRTARQRQDQGRHSPTQKRIQFAKRAETVEAQETLRNWGRGSIVPQTTKQTQPRQPLHERSINTTTLHPCVLSDKEDVQSTHPAAAIATRQSEAARRTASETQNVRKGHTISSAIRPFQELAPAQLELEKPGRRALYSTQRHQPVLLSRFLNRITIPPRISTPLPTPSHSGPRLAKQRKRRPRQVSVVPSIEDDNCFEEAQEHAVLYEPMMERESSSLAVSGLLPHGVEYSTDFSTYRLPDGPHFSHNSLIGSGLFKQSLTTNKGHGYDGPFRSGLPKVSIEWDGWNASLADEIFMICDTALSLITPKEDAADEISLKESNQRLRALITYLSRHLKFLDSIDRREFVDNWMLALERYAGLLNAILDDISKTGRSIDATAQTACHFAILANQIQQISEHLMISQSAKQSISAASTSILDCTLRVVLNHGFEDFRTFTRDSVNLSNSSIRQTSLGKTETLVVCLHLLQRQSLVPTMWFRLRQQGCLVLPVGCKSVATFEKLWKDLFTLLPLLEIDEAGNISHDVSVQDSAPNWQLVKQLIDPILKALPVVSAKTTIGQYCRALYARCFQLLHYWGWGECESIMGLLFDFFAQNGLRDLSMEAPGGSPTFLTCLNNETGLSLRSSDSSFHILLKMIGEGLRLMRGKVSDKKIGNSVWRLTPNHDRSLPKDQAIRQEDLQAVRNHLDLLTVLYWAAPAQYRIRFDALRGLIDIKTSHREVCHIVIRSWSNLVTFQLSTQEPSEALDPFMSWYDEIVSKAIVLHKLARSEVEADAKIAESKYGQLFSRDQQERIILESQRHAEAILFDALSTLKATISNAVTADVLRKMLPSCLRNTLDGFDVTQVKIRPLIGLTIDLIQAWTSRARHFNHARDSQGYGDWSELQELVPDIELTKALTITADLDKALHQLILSTFGADVPIEDSFCHKIVNCWLDVADLEIKAGYLTWDDLLDPYASKSWTSLRDTPQTRRFTPLFLTRLMTSEASVYTRKKMAILSQWVACLVERESLIRYQNDLTSALLNADISEPLLQNPPFWRDSSTGTFEISLGDFIERRLSLLSCLLSNMKESLSFSMYHQLPDVQEKRKNYSELLRHLMNTMKNNYQELEEGSDARGSYVDLVQRAIQLYQEHASDICKVDGFFLDAVNFPLPENDPEYLEAKLKYLASQLQRNGGPQQLVAFVQSICERAVIEGKQDHFASLFVRAMEDAHETIKDGRTTLRLFLCCHLVPIYNEFVFQTPCGWALADTLLLSIPPVLNGLLQHVNTLDDFDMTAVRSIVASLLGSIVDSIGKYLSNLRNLDAQTLMVLTRYYSIIEASLEAAEFACRCSCDEYSASTRQLLSQFTDLMIFCANAGLCLIGAIQHVGSGVEPPCCPNMTWTSDLVQIRYMDATSQFANDSLHDALSPSSTRLKWRLDGNQLRVHRSTRWDPVSTNLGNTQQQQAILISAIRGFIDRLSSIPSFRFIVAEAQIDGKGWDAYGGKELELKTRVLDSNLAIFHMY